MRVKDEDDRIFRFYDSASFVSTVHTRARVHWPS